MNEPTDLRALATATYGEDSLNNAIGALWPYDGPHDQDTVSDAARALPELVRYLNNATQGGRTLEWASTSYTVLGSVAAAVGGLDQLLDQIGHDLVTKAADDRTLYDDRRHDGDYPAGRTALEVDNTIREAMHRLHQAAENLRTAAGEALHLGNNTEDDQ